jgi:hypothetical protein
MALVCLHACVVLWQLLATRVILECGGVVLFRTVGVQVWGLLSSDEYR